MNIESGNLEIDHADNINFGTIMLDGKARDGKTNNLSTVKPADSANPQIKINDFRGSNDIGWQLSVKINSDKNSFKDTGMDISFFSFNRIK
ncbi:WxL domain-containing protein [Holzapfeliella floricola]|uniref:WxL domain-containing protein n=1 Tax=Holzapfeliella floricola TaxID=679249 RepID=UPI001A9338AA|nr:WxL domain-containing protein [Holzapfeliella floricola]